MKKPRGQFVMGVIRWRWLIVKGDCYARVQQAGWELFAYMHLERRAAGSMRGSAGRRSRPRSC
jgi:hypothetical protein